MNNLKPYPLNVAYFHEYLMSYDLIISYIHREINCYEPRLRHFPSLELLLGAVKENKIDVLMINSSSLFDGGFNEVQVRNLLSVLCENKHTITVLFAQTMKPILLKKMSDAGVDIIVSPQDTPGELVTALLRALRFDYSEPYMSPLLKNHLLHTHEKLTTKEWEVINLIKLGYSLSQIASKKCRAMSTISTQKRNAMNKLHIKNESELLHFLHQNSFF